MYTHQGISIIEILMTMSILSLIMLHVLTNENDSMQLLRASRARQIAVHQIDAMTSILKYAGQYDVSALLHDWQETNRILLPHGQSRLDQTMNGFDVWILWDNAHSRDCRKINDVASGCIHVFLSA